MDPKTRLLAIRLMENLRKNPAYAQTLGVQVTLKRSPPDGEPPKKSRLRPDTGRPGDLKEIRLKGWAPIPIWRRLRASLLGEALFCREN